jgi:predicted RNA-binding Zn-ribbon protein involved in translation (DUF1610 family)
MSKLKCPNCGEFKFKKNTSTIGCGLSLIFGVPILAVMTSGGSDYFGGRTSLNVLLGIAVISVIIGIIVIIISLISPDKTVKYTCENCDFEQEYEK